MNAVKAWLIAWVTLAILLAWAGLLTYNILERLLP